MEWARAKTILIITFFLLNVILGYQLWITKVADSYFEQAGIREEVQQLLRSKNIRLEKEIPRETPQLREITVTLSGDKNAIEPVRLERPFKLQQLARKRIAKDIEKQIPFIDEYEYDPIQSREGLYVMNQLYEQWPMFEINLNLFYEEDEVYQYTATYAEIESSLDEEEVKVLSAYRAIAFLAENVLAPGTVIEEVRLGYHGQVFDSDIQVLAPKWRIALANGEVYYVHAISGELEQTRLNEKP